MPVGMRRKRKSGMPSKPTTTETTKKTYSQPSRMRTCTEIMVPRMLPRNTQTPQMPNSVLLPRPGNHWLIAIIEYGKMRAWEAPPRNSRHMDKVYESHHPKVAMAHAVAMSEYASTLRGPASAPTRT